MKVFGFTIQYIGLEFHSREDRERAMLLFSRSSTVKISTLGIRFQDQESPFGTYERDTKEMMVNCCSCRGVHSIDVCPKREYPYKNYSNNWTTENDHICDSCFIEKKKAKEVHDAKQVLKKDEKEEIPI